MTNKQSVKQVTTTTKIETTTLTHEEEMVVRMRKGLSEGPETKLEMRTFASTDLADMVRQMVGTMVPLGWCGGDGQGGLGSDVGAILRAIEAAWSDDGVAVLVDLGGAAMQAEMAIELLDEGRRARVQICEAPLVEGAVIAATEASGGSDLAAVQAMAEQLSP